MESLWIAWKQYSLKILLTTIQVCKNPRGIISYNISVITPRGSNIARSCISTSCRISINPISRSMFFMSKLNLIWPVPGTLHLTWTKCFDTSIYVLNKYSSIKFVSTICAEFRAFINRNPTIRTKFITHIDTLTIYSKKSKKVVMPFKQRSAFLAKQLPKKTFFKGLFNNKIK